MKNPLRLRILTVFIGFMALFTIILGKALKVQLIDRDALMARSKSQFLRETKIYPKRGNIYDRNGNPLAINVTTYSIFTIPKILKGDRSSYRKLSKIVPELTYKKIKKKVHKRKRYTFLARKIPLTKAQVSKIKKLKGIYIESVPKRLYPNHELLSQIVGFVGLDNVGLAGLEYQFDKELKGEPKVIKYIKDAKGRAVKFESQSAGDTSKDIHLTIDKEIQAVAERYLKEAVIEHKAIKGGIGVMDVESGEILAMANYPTFEPNKWKKSKESLRKSSFLSNPIEPGSVFKILTVASALENKIARPDTNYYCEQGRFLVQGHTIKEADSSEAFEWLSMEDIIVHSSNIGTTKIAFDITYPNLKATLEAFNIGKKTGIEAPGESRGIFMNADNISPLSLSNISFGQGVATTGIQMLAVYAAIANGGIYNSPTIIRNGVRKSTREPVRVLSKQTADELTQMLVKAVDIGTGSKAQIPYFKVAGKTSTAQRPDSNGGYTGYIPGFVGYPVNVEKKFVIYVYVEDPQGKVYYGNLVAAPVFKKVAQYILYKNKDFSQLAMEKAGTQDSLKSFDSVTYKRSSVRTQQKDTVPNFLGLDKFSVKQLAKRFGLTIKNKGIGVVEKQKPVAGKRLKPGQIISLKYSPPHYE